MIRPAPLVKGQTIGIATPASKADESFVLKACAVIESWGFQVALAKHWLTADSVYLSATDEQRLEDLQQMLDNPDIQAIFCARGGYGTTRIVDRLAFGKFIRHPKWVAGFSDITALHLKLYALGVESIHGSMPVQFHKPEYADSIESLRKLIIGEAPAPFDVEGFSFNRQGNGTGRMIGGNLSLLADSLGTSTSPDTEGKILIVEEVGEPLYKIDRMLMQLKRAGKLSHLAGLVMGHFSDLRQEKAPFDESLQAIVLGKVREFPYPVAFGFPIGHEAPNLAWRHASTATLSVTPTQALLTFEQ